MPFPGPPAENEPPPPIIMLSTAKGMKSSSCFKKIHKNTIHLFLVHFHRSGSNGATY